jgi:hypothetical protein
VACAATVAGESVSPIQEVPMIKPAVLALAVVAFVPLAAQAETVVTSSRDYGFFANWGKVSACPGEPDKFQLVSAFVGFQENSTDRAGNPRAIAFVSLSYSSDCTGSETSVPVDASGATDPFEYGFPVDFQQSYSIDKRIGRQGLAYATYRATIPIFFNSHDCYKQATVDFRMDERGPQDPSRSFSRTVDNGTITMDFIRGVIRPAEPIGHITLSPRPGETCDVSGLPADLNFALYPQVFNEFDGSPASFIYKTFSATLTRPRLGH